jgi:hypothetical protein
MSDFTEDVSKRQSAGWIERGEAPKEDAPVEEADAGVVDDREGMIPNETPNGI